MSDILKHIIVLVLLCLLVNADNLVIHLYSRPTQYPAGKKYRLLGVTKKWGMYTPIGGVGFLLGGVTKKWGCTPPIGGGAKKFPGCHRRYCIKTTKPI